MECGTLLLLSARQLAGRRARKEASWGKAGASSRTPYPRDFDGTLGGAPYHLAQLAILGYN